MSANFIDSDANIYGQLNFYKAPNFQGQNLIRPTLQDKGSLLPYDFEIAKNSTTNRPCFGISGTWYDLALDSASGFQNANYNYFVAPNFTANVAPYFSTIQAAINSCPSGGACVINVYPGVYSGLTASNKTIMFNALGNVWINVSAGSPASFSSCPQIFFKGAFYLMNSPSGGFTYPNNTALSSYVLSVSGSNLYGEIAWVEGINFSGSNCDLKIMVLRNSITANSSCGWLIFDIGRLGENSTAPVPLSFAGGQVNIEAKFAFCNLYNSGAKLSLKFLDGCPGNSSYFTRGGGSSGFTTISGGTIRREAQLSGSATYGAASIIWASGTGHKTTVANCRIDCAGTSGGNDSTIPIWVENSTSKLKLQDVQICQANTTTGVWNNTNAGSGVPIQTMNVIANKNYNSSFSYVGQTPLVNSNLWV